MKKTNTISITVIISILIFFSVTANAFNGERKGFILGGGIGLGFTSFTQELAGYDPGFGWIKIESDRESKAAIMTDFKIGYAPSNFWEICYFSKVSWFGIENAYSNKVTVANGAEGLGATYYLNPEAPSPFFTGGIGLSTWSLPFESNAPNPWYGLGLYAGGGYEFARHVSVELDLLWGRPSDEEAGIEVSTNAFSIKVTINALAY